MLPNARTEENDHLTFPGKFTFFCQYALIRLRVYLLAIAGIYPFQPMSRSFILGDNHILILWWDNFIFFLAL